MSDVLYRVPLSHPSRRTWVEVSDGAWSIRGIVVAGEVQRAQCRLDDLGAWHNPEDLGLPESVWGDRWDALLIGGAE